MAKGYPENRFYVYLLIDPRDNSIFYVGKGSGARKSTHAAIVKRGRTDHNLDKCSRIEEILTAGYQVAEFILKDGLTERDALNIEAGAIRCLRHSGITNIAYGRIGQTRGAWMLSHLKPLDEWLRSGDLTGLVNPKAFYDQFRATLEDIAENGWISEIVCDHTRHGDRIRTVRSYV